MSDQLDADPTFRGQPPLCDMNEVIAAIGAGLSQEDVADAVAGVRHMNGFPGAPPEPQSVAKTRTGDKELVLQGTDLREVLFLALNGSCDGCLLGLDLEKEPNGDYMHPAANNKNMKSLCKANLLRAKLHKMWGTSEFRVFRP